MPVSLSNPNPTHSNRIFMNPAPIGTRIQVVSKNNHSYKIGKIYRVHQVDGDGTFKAIDDMGIEGDYLRWRNCEAVGIGWEWIRGQLDARSLDLLSAFDGLEHLRIRDDVETTVINAMPDLAETILQMLPKIEEDMEKLQNSSEGEDDDFDLLQNLS